MLWDNGYALPIVTLMDPKAARSLIKLFCEYGFKDGVPLQNGFGYARQSPNLMNNEHAFSSNMSSLMNVVAHHIHMTGDASILHEQAGARTVLEHLRTLEDQHDRRPQWNGLAHYGGERNLFDPGTVKGYVHWVAAPNAGAVWTFRRLADFEEMEGNADEAARLRAKADKLARDLIENLYNNAPEYAGTWKQRHEDGRFSQLRHGWDFMLTGSYLYPDLPDAKKQQMVDWLFNQIVRLDSNDIWVITQDQRDGNNGTHQMEHNGMGAYPAWPYHYGWALKNMGYEKKMIALLELIDGITVFGPLGQGSLRDGRRARSNWVDAAGASMASYIIYLLFDFVPDEESLAVDPVLQDFDPSARLVKLPFRGKLRTVDAQGMHPSP